MFDMMFFFFFFSGNAPLLFRIVRFCNFIFVSQNLAFYLRNCVTVLGWSYNSGRNKTSEYTLQ